MLRAMRRVLGLFVFALVLPWLACEDRTVSLSEDQGTSLTSSGGSGGGGSGGDSTSSGGTSDGGTSSGGSGSGGSFGNATNGDGGSGGSFSPGNTNFSATGFGTTVSFGFGSGGSNSSSGATNHGGSGPFGTSTFTTGGNEGGQGPECQDGECGICAGAMRDCSVPTPDCTEYEAWHLKCNRCYPQCAPGLACVHDFKCSPTCLGDGTCPDPDKPHCDLTFGACVQCYEAEHCAEFGQLCLAGECVDCINQDDCSGNDYCIAGECVECVSNSDCDGGRSCDQRNRCIEIECMNDVDCDEENPICNFGACAECRGDTGCDEDEYCFNFTCLPE